MKYVDLEIKCCYTLNSDYIFQDLGITDPRCIVDGIIYSLRPNGFLVHIPAYGLKGPVYLESKVHFYFIYFDSQI